MIISMNIVILAGGVGSRLWPMSRQHKPKQFYEIISDQPMIRDTVNRFVKDFSLDKIYFSAAEQFVPGLKQLLPEFSAGHYIVEPEKRDSGPAMGFAAVKLFLTNPDEPFVFIPSDHYIGDVKKFIQSLKVAEGLIKETGRMLDISFTPSRPTTTLGYTHIGEKFHEIDGVEVYRFLGHKEKPNFELAQKYLQSGEYLWHGNYYMWTPRLFLEAIKRYNPNMSARLEKIRELLVSGDKEKNQELINQEFQRLEKISIDYALTEKMDPSEVLIIKGDFGWSDIGAWDALYNSLSLKHDEQKNLVQGNYVNINSSGNLIYGQKSKLIATIGIDDLIIVDTPDALLICPKAKAQEVKKIGEKMAAAGQQEWL